MGLHFCEYEAWMKNQVIDMFCIEYGNNKDQFTEYYDRFYSTFQEQRALRFAILNEQTVVGFVSFSYWPYIVKGKVANSYQCGNVIIHKDFRGKGLYNQLLNYVNENALNYNIDFIVGFPIKEILKLYLKSNWKNPFNLNWYVKIINPFGGLFKISEGRIANFFKEEKEHVVTFPKPEQIILSVDTTFYAWNKSYNNMSKHYYFNFAEGQHHIEFSLKVNKRKYLNELIIGEINTNSNDLEFIKKGFKKLKGRATKLMGVSILSLCLNDLCKNDVVLKAATSCGFKIIKKDIKFIVNAVKMTEQELMNPEDWILYRRDIDTW